MQTIVLSGSIRETYAWARAQERNLRSVRHAANAASISGRNFDGIVELPSFRQRRDRHAVMAAVKRVQRALPRIPYELDEDWVMPPPRVRVEKKLIDPSVFRFSDLPEVKPLGDLWFDAVHAEADEDFSIEESPDETVQDADPELPEAETSDESEVAPVPVAAEVTAHETFEVVQPVDVPETSEESVQPKKRGRRTNQQKAYDEALSDWENNGGSLEAVIEAREALAERHPDDERLATAIPGDPRDADELGF